MPVPLARFDLYLQGATVSRTVTISAGASTAVHVADVGALYDGGAAQAGPAGPVFTIVSVDSPTQVTLKNTSVSSLTIPFGTRLVMLSSRPTAYPDALGIGSAIGSTVYADSAGTATVYVPEGVYDYFVSDPAEVAVASDTVSTNSISGGYPSLTVSHTVPSGATVLIAAILWQEGTGGETLDSVTCNATAMTRLASAPLVDVYYLLNPTAGSSSVVSTWSGSSAKAAYGAVLALSHTNADTPLATPKVANTTSTTVGISNAGATPKGLTVAAAGVNTILGIPTVTIGAGVTSLWSASVGSTGDSDRTQALGGEWAGNGSAASMLWALSASRAWGAVSFEALPSAWVGLVTDASALAACPQEFGLLATNYASLQAAVDALPASGGVVYVPAGTYRLIQGLRIYKPNVTLIGEGVTTILTPADPTNSPIDLITVGASDVRISRLKLDGAAVAMDLDEGHCGIVYDGDDHGAAPARLVQHCFLENVVVVGNSRYGLWLRDTVLLTAINCEIVQNQGGGMRIQGAEEGGVCGGLRFIGCAFSSNGWIGVDVGDTDVETGMVQISLWGCTIENNQGGTTVAGRDDIGVDVNANQSLKIELVSCFFEGPPETPAHTQDGCAQMLRFHNCPNVLVRDCVVDGTLTTDDKGATYGVVFLNCSYAQVESNVIQGVTDYILKFDSGCDDCLEVCNRDLDIQDPAHPSEPFPPRILIQGRRVIGMSRWALGINRVLNPNARPPDDHVQTGTLVWVDSTSGSNPPLQVWTGTEWKGIALSGLA